jgi:GNAT superfamily N-acetyltransferase
VASYRFCRTDDIGLLVDALNRCWAPYFPGEPPMTAAAFKRSIRDLQVWCSSCMVAFSDADPIGVLIGAKRPSGTLIHRIAVHPDHLRQGHGRHLLASLSSKLAILGPPRIIAEVPETLVAACELFSASGYVHEAALTDYVLELDEDGSHELTHVPARPERRSSFTLRTNGVDGFVIPITIDDLAANGLLETTESRVCWEHAVETLTARKAEVAGLAIASDERIEAYVLHVMHEGAATEILALRSLVEDDGARLHQLLARHRGPRGLTFQKVHASEMSADVLAGLGFSPGATYRLYATKAHSG